MFDECSTFLQDANKFLLPNYRPYPIVLERGEGALLWDVSGKEYIDLTAGIAVASLGHGNQSLAKVINDQCQKLLHSSNILLNQPEVELAKLLCESASMQRVFFCNSGAEANEAMLKLARRCFSKSDPDRFEIICMSKAFHGRTLGTISATGQEKYRKGFGPLLPGFKVVPFGDFSALEKAVNKNTAAIFMEPILGEGGIIVPPKGYLSNVRELCNKTGCLLLLDEVQTGIGRTGLMFAFEHEGVSPDAMALAKGLGGGFPIGAMLVKEQFADVLDFPSHGSTFGGNPVACAAGKIVIQTVSEPKFLANVRLTSAFLENRLNKLKEKYPHLIQEVRGRGLLLGVQFVNDPEEFKERALSKGLIVNFCGERVLRIAPPLIISNEILERALSIIEEIFHG